MEHPERFGAPASAVCNNVQMMELLRGEKRHEKSESEFEASDVDLSRRWLNQQRRRQVDSVLKELPEKEREFLRMFFLEERDQADLCRRFAVGEDYLRVLLHRAKLRFKSMYTKRCL